MFDAGLPGGELKGTVTRQTDPAYWHPLYVQKQKAFARALGKKYNGMKGLEFVDIGAVGEWGESHLTRWSPQDKLRAGYSPTAYTRAYMEIMDAYRRAFPDTTVLLNCWTGGHGHQDALVDYAVAKGIGLRQDGLRPNYPRDIASRYFHENASRVPCLYEFMYTFPEMRNLGLPIPKTIERGLEDPISYMNICIGRPQPLRTLTPEERKAVVELAKRIGYRFIPQEVIRPTHIPLQKGIRPRTWLKINWTNTGVAPCYEHYAVELTLCARDGKEHARFIEFPEQPTTKWLPGKTVTTSFSLVLPSEIPPGDYTWKLALLSPLDETRRLKLPLQGQDTKLRYPICRLPAKPESPDTHAQPAADLCAWTKWRPAKGINLSVVQDDRTRAHCLRIEGHSEKGWSYATSPAIPVLPQMQYRFSGKMKVLHVDGAGTDPTQAKRWQHKAKAPKFKIGLQNSAGKWAGNVWLPPYDMDKPGTWQDFQQTFTTTEETAAVSLDASKGSDSPRSVLMLVADLKLELLGEPK
ncbi:MAG: DUF4832 domain-containing protein [Verrucomicrobiae bacterium]|nr:DUF4832 domain-containing protein [Verrucomicrobiae bacterium]